MFYSGFLRSGCKNDSFPLAVEGLMNYTNHCLQSHFSLAEQGCGGSLLKRRHQSENTITHFQWEEKQCCLWPPGLWFCSQLLLPEVDIPPLTDAGCPLLHTPGRHTKSPCWTRDEHFLVPSHVLSPCLLASHTCGLQWHHYHPAQPSAGTCWGHLGCSRWK